MSYGKMKMSSQYGSGSGASSMAGMPLITGTSANVYSERPMGYGPLTVGYGSAYAGGGLFQKKGGQGKAGLLSWTVSKAIDEMSKPLPLPPVPPEVVAAGSNEIGVEYRIAYWYARAARVAYSDSQYSTAAALAAYAHSAETQAWTWENIRMTPFGQGADTGKVEGPQALVMRFQEAIEYVASQGVSQVSKEMAASKANSVGAVQASQKRADETPGRDKPTLPTPKIKIPKAAPYIAGGAALLLLGGYAMSRKGSRKKNGRRRRRNPEEGLLHPLAQKSLDKSPLSLRHLAGMGAISLGVIATFGTGAVTGGSTLLVGLPLLYLGFQAFDLRKTEDEPVYLVDDMPRRPRKKWWQFWRSNGRKSKARRLRARRRKNSRKSRRRRNPSPVRSTQRKNRRSMKIRRGSPLAY